MLFVGDDWAEDHHDVYLMNDTGGRLASRRLPEGLAGIGRLHGLIAEHAEDPAQVVIGIETDRGLWVDALTAAGYQVFAVNPLAAARYRDRHHVSGAKSDASDAKLLADLVRTDRHNHRPIAGDSPDAEAIKVLARAQQNLIWVRTRHTNGLRSALREYYPAALEAFDDLADRDALAILGRGPDPRRRWAPEPVEDPVSTQNRWATTQPRHPGAKHPGRVADSAAHRPRRGHRRIRRHHPGYRRHHR
jgi:transposase